MADHPDREILDPPPLQFQDMTDHQKQVYQKIKTMKEVYLTELNEAYLKIAGGLRKHENLPQQLKYEKIEKLKGLKRMLERILAFLQAENNTPLPTMEKVGFYEKQITTFLNSNWKRIFGSPMKQPQQLPLFHVQQQQYRNMIDRQKQQLFQLQRTIVDPPATSLNTTVQAESANSDHWQEEVYQKIKTMKEAYLPELNEMYLKVSAKRKHEDVEKLEDFKEMLRRVMAFLQVSKTGVLPCFKERLGSYEKQIFRFLIFKRQREPGPSMQQPPQLPPSYIQPHHPKNMVVCQKQQLFQWSSMQLPQQLPPSHLQPQHPKNMVVRQKQQLFQWPSMQLPQQLPPSHIQPQHPKNMVVRQKQQLFQWPSMQLPQQLPPSHIQPQHSKNMVVRQKQQLFQLQRATPDFPATSSDTTGQAEMVNSDDWQEDVYQKIKTMKEAYLLELNEIYLKIVGTLEQQDNLPQQLKNEKVAVKLEQYDNLPHQLKDEQVAVRLEQQDNLPQQLKDEQVEKLELFKEMLGHVITFLQVPKAGVLPSFKERLGGYEKQINIFLNGNWRRELGTSMQQLPPSPTRPHQPQISQVQPRGDLKSSQAQSKDVQNSE